VSNRLKENTKEMNISIDKIVKSSDFLNNNIEDLKNKIKEDVEKIVHKSVVDNKRNLSDLNKAISTMKDEIIKQNRNNLNKLMAEISRVYESLMRSISNLNTKIDTVERSLEKKNIEHTEQIKKFMLLIIILSILNILLIIYLIYSRA
ncbi:hypothetical protein G6Z07_13895, partial [Clostridium perfringens]